MIDRNLNYGRDVIKQFLQDAAPYGTVLDVAAGPGEDLMNAREFSPNCRSHAIECSDYWVQYLESNGVTVSHANIEHDKFPFEDNSFDVIIANQIFEHTKEIFWIMHEITRILPVGGRLIIGVPNLASLHNRLLLLAGKQPSSLKNTSAHIRGYTKEDVVRLFNDCFPGGYKLISYAGSNFYPFPPFIATKLAKILPSMAWSIFFMLEKQKPYNSQFIDYPTKNQLETNFYVG